MNGARELDAIVPYFEDGANLAVLLRALEAQTVVPRSVIVVDDGSWKEPAVSVLARTPTRLNVRVVRQANEGAASARNRGAFEAGAETLAFVDSDCIPDPDWLASMARALDENGLDVAYGSVRSDSGFPYPRWTAPGGQAMISASIALRRGAFQRLGGFDESYFGYREDTDFGLRACAAGLSVGCSTRGGTYHPVRRQGFRRLWRAGLLHANDPLLARRHGREVFNDLGQPITKPSIPPGLSPAGVALSVILVGACASAARNSLYAAAAWLALGLTSMAVGTFAASLPFAARRTPTELLTNAAAGVPYLCGWYVGRVQGSLRYRTWCL
ncbi:MAG: glycosyltransferase [Candidatus Baltobacteraceae bacterium]